ncbi:fimbrial protein [Photobacterium damselae]|uniref:fimbrial protein n=1 Tax=Photobacterium damselae TaxID=38293 RepID=UPI001EFC8CAF|nr:fimbrial protein [Photobacterium damselae]MCG9780359.1 fimbrial protein [Photobacterium damselae]
MKNAMTLAAVVIGALVSGSAAAATGTINFIGSVTDSTCSFTPSQNGALGNTVHLGDYAVVDVANHATVVDFNLVGKNADGSACTATGTGNGDIDVTWLPTSGHWGVQGLFNEGTATGVEVKLMDKDSKVFTATRDTVNYKAADVTNAVVPFKAQLVQTSAATAATAGTVTASASFSVAYK